MKRQRVTQSAIAALTAVVLFAGPAMAVDLPGPSYVVTAAVPAGLTFSVTVVELIPVPGSTTGATTIGPVVTAMNFANLASNGTFDPDGTGPLPAQPRSLNSLKAFQAFFGVNAQQRPFTVKQTAGPLQGGGNVIPAGAFIVTPLDGVGGDTTKPLPAGLTKGTRQSAIGTNLVLFSRATNGSSDTMAATYGITDDPTKGATAFIPLDQAAGTYTTTITFTATVV